MPALGECNEWRATGFSVLMGFNVSHKCNFNLEVSSYYRHPMKVKHFNCFSLFVFMTENQ